MSFFEEDPPSIHDQTRATDFGRRFAEEIQRKREQATIPIVVAGANGYPKYTSGEQYAIKAAARDLLNNWSNTDFEQRIHVLYDLMVKAEG